MLLHENGLGCSAIYNH